MKKILSILCVGILSIGILKVCMSNSNSSNEIAKLKSELDIAYKNTKNSNKEIKELEKEIETKNRNLELKAKTRECIDDEALQWLKIKDWDKIIIGNRSTNEKVEIKGKDLPRGFTLYSSLGSLITYENIVYEGKDSPAKTEFYTYEFFKDNNKYQINIWADEIAQIIDKKSKLPKYYKSSNLEILGDSFSPPAEYQYTDNILNKIYNSGMLLNNTKGCIVNSIKSKEIAKYIVSTNTEGALVKVNKIPNINFERKVRATAYWHGEKININLYIDGDIEYIEIIHNKESVIYKDTTPYSMEAYLT